MIYMDGLAWCLVGLDIAFLVIFGIMYFILERGE